MQWFLSDINVLLQTPGIIYLFQIEMKDNLINQCNIEKDREKMRTRRMAAKTEKLVKEKENTLKERKDIEVRIHKNFTYFSVCITNTIL